MSDLRRQFDLSLLGLGSRNREAADLERAKVVKLREALMDIVRHDATCRKDDARDWLYALEKVVDIARRALVDTCHDDPGVEDRACPCLHTTPCHERCTCVMPFSSSGCARCCTYGSKEQQQAMAVRLAKAIDSSHDPKMLVSDRDGRKHQPAEVAEFLDALGDRSADAVGEELHDAADVVRSLAHRATCLEQLECMAQLDQPWPLHDVLEKLADAADHLLKEHACDKHGYEEVGRARDVAREMLEALRGSRVTAK